MSIESNLKSIAESLKGIAEIQEETLRTIKNLADTIVRPPVVVESETIKSEVVPGPIIETSQPPFDINSIPAAGVVADERPEPPKSKPKEQAIEESETETAAPVTLDELKAFSDWLNEMVDFLGADSGKKIFDVFKKHGIQNLPDIGDDRAKLNAIKADVEALAQ